MIKDSTNLKLYIYKIIYLQVILLLRFSITIENRIENRIDRTKSIKKINAWFCDQSNAQD